MTITDTIPAWMTKTPPACPAWCVEPAGHHNPTNAPGDWTRFHVAYRQTLPTAGGVLVEVASHESWEGGVLATEPAGLTIIGGEDLTPADATRLLGMVTEATTVLATISAGA